MIKNVTFYFNIYDKKEIKDTLYDNLTNKEKQNFISHEIDDIKKFQLKEIKDTMNNEQTIEVEYIKIDNDIDYSQIEVTCGLSDIKKILDKHELNYEKNKVINNVLKGKSLRYDYYVNELNCFIEFNDILSYSDVDQSDINQEKHLIEFILDKKKSDYAFENNINLIRIPYWSDVSQIKIKINRLIRNNQLRLNNKDQKYLQAFTQTLNLNYIEMNKIYEDYEDMLKKLKVNSKLSYPIFKKYLIVNYDLERKKIINKNNDWFEIYSQLNDDEYEKYKTNKLNNQFKNLIYQRINELFDNNKLNCQYVLKEMLYIDFLRKYNFTDEDITFRGYIKYLTKIIKEEPYLIDTRSRTSIHALNNKRRSYFKIDNHNLDEYKLMTYYKNLNYNK